MMGGNISLLHDIKKIHMDFEISVPVNVDNFTFWQKEKKVMNLNVSNC